MSSSESTNAKTMSIIVTKGTLDCAYPPFVLATTAAAMGVDVTMLFTFYGLPLLLKKLDLEVTPLGNPAMKMPMMGMHMAMPNLVGMLPGATAAATTMMKNPLSTGRTHPPVSASWIGGVMAFDECAGVGA